MCKKCSIQMSKNLGTIFIINCACGCLAQTILGPSSDGEVISAIGSWAQQNSVKVDEVTVEIISARLNWANDRALVRFRIRGTMWDDEFLRPRITRVFVSQRFGKSNFGKLYGDIQINPVCQSRADNRYGGEPVSFDLMVEQIIHSLDWGENRYQVVAGECHEEFILYQEK